MWLSAADDVIEARVTMDGLYFGQPTPICFLFLVFFLKRSAFECSACICARSDDDFCFPEPVSAKNALRVFLFPVISTKYRRDVTEFRIGSVHMREMWIPE
jgi:hypothetical protein